MLNDHESPSTVWASIQDTVFQVVQIIDIRLALLIGLAAFMLAVGFDSSGNKAEAADLITGSASMPVSVSVAESSATYSFTGETLVDNGQIATARRLRHGSLTSSIITSNRLTEAHFFVDLPSER
ncbi:hypothetical protein VB780_12520 [Leptolyngbya sp. CCNP1308]|uniref:hypothetical protein n=1 Tax=Leptolyngbya sp. CCNP1308 TaxID=3110255 RepID=UPI002B210930|nr:hypothetical protein [Leptolyngbya sp. CCNP1308]MEA5449399.1 hypothetical protein [Leptolyngbya sp. CCNP1308]